MKGVNLMGSFSEFKEFKNIDRETMTNILADVFRNMILKRWGADDGFDIIINSDRGDLEIWRTREVVPDGELDDEVAQIEVSMARKIVEDLDVGEELIEEIKIEDFGRRNILAMRQNLAARIQELEKDHIYQKYKERVGDIITGEVYQVWRKEILVLDDEDNELLLPHDQQIPSDYYKKGDTIRAVVYEVDMRNNNPQIILSRTAPEFLEKLFEQEVPEVFDGLITIKKIVREPGERAKVAVESYDDRIDPVGACVGMKGSRIHSIVRELRNENIDVIQYTNNDQLLISRALAPAKISSINLDRENGKADVFLKPDQVSLAIGKGGHNIRLAGRLTGFDLDVYREAETDIDDVDLDEFSDEIDSWIIDELKSIGCDTARSVLDISKEELVKRTDLEEETVDEVLRILREELD
ncbi:MAG: transcription termination/antitermination protein NusA [Crocinitomicaceae bacterium]|nr:transcription termination/antitermination protein NusA [Crocinitomicaceae bacterium]